MLACRFLLCSLLLTLAARTPPNADPVDVFADLNGTWTGIFVGYDAGGRELYRIAVTQIYERVDANTQRVTLEDRMPDGTTVTGTGENTAIRNGDGSLTLACRVAKSNGDVVTHAGRLVRGPDGDTQLIWHSSSPDRVETFREHVHGTGDEAVYEINGMGRYGDTLILMHGRYHRRPDTS